MTKQILIDLATLEQIVWALEVAFQAEGDTFGMMHNDAVDALTAARAAIAGAELVEPMPPFGSKRKAAMAVYVPPFRFEHGYIFDSRNHMVADNGPICDGPSVEGAVAARVRGWGKLGYLPNGAELQDEIGQMMADALNELYAKESKA